MEIWKLYEHQNIFLKYFPALHGETEVEYNYRLLKIPGLFTTKLNINETFLLSDGELLEYLQSNGLIRQNSYTSYLTRLSSHYILQSSDGTIDEFYDYLDRLKILNVLRIFNMIDKYDELVHDDYFVKRWKKGIETYRDIIRELFDLGSRALSQQIHG